MKTASSPARIAALLLAGASALCWAAFPDDPPSDTDWPAQYHFRNDNVGAASPDPTFEYPLARDRDGHSGMSIEAAWREGRAEFGDAAMGRPDVFLAYMEGGINWHAGSGPGSTAFKERVVDLLPKIHLNRLEIERSSRYLPSLYLDNGDPWYNSLDFPAIPDANGNSVIDAEDVIVYFSDGKDDDGNGYVDDISGWDFYNNQNDPTTVDQQYTHCNNQMRKGVGVADNGIGLAGVCPRCMVMPVKEGAEALDRSDEVAQAKIFAADSGANGYITETADLGYSTFARRAQEHAWERGLTVAGSTNDFDSNDHQGAAYWSREIGCNSLIADSAGKPDTGLPTDGVSKPNQEATTFRRRSGKTSWGTKNWISDVTADGSTSASCGVMLGILGLVQSWSLEGVDRGYLRTPLTPSEIMQVLREGVDDIVPGDDVGWPVHAGWDLQTGYGRTNLRKVQKIIASGRIPPEAYFDSPEWFGFYDPAQGGTIEISGHVGAPRAGGFTWTLEWAAVPGAEPTDDQFLALASGSGGIVPYRGKLGELPLSAIQESFYRAAFAINDNRREAEKHLPSTEQFTVTFRLRVTDDNGLTGEERRTVFVHNDASGFPGFPRPTNQNHAGAEGGVRLADLAGSGTLQIVYADMDGIVHAYDPVARRELPGWPVTLDPVATQVPVSGRGIDLGHEPVPMPIAVGDLDHDGHLWIVVTSSTGKVYIFNEHGARRAGWPKVLDAGVQAVEQPRRVSPFMRRPAVGAFSAPVLQDMDGDGTLEIIQSAWDGHIHIFRNDGSRELPGWPVKVELPAGYSPALPNYVVVRDEKLEATPVIANLDADPQWEVVIRSQMADTMGTEIQPIGFGHLLAYDNDGSLMWMTTMQSVIHFHGSAQEFITEGNGSPVAADIDGDGIDEVTGDPVFNANVYVYRGDGTEKIRYLGAGAGTPPVPGPAPSPAVTIPPLPALPVDLAVSFTTTGGFGRFGAARALTFAQGGSNAVSIAGALLLAGSGSAIVNVERAWDAQAGVMLPGFPAIAQGLNFLGSPIFADVTGDGAAEIIEGSDSAAIHAWNDLGQQATGFPKFMSGWTLYSPTAGDLDSDGRTEVVVATREGYLFAWKTAGTAAGNNEWWTYRHDEWNTGRYGTDTRPPGVVRNLVADPVTHTLSFTAPGDDWYAGRVQKYVIRSVPAADGSFQEVVAEGASLPEAGMPTTLAASAIERGFLSAVDDAGNLGRRAGFAFSGEVPTEAATPPPATSGDRGRFGIGALAPWMLVLFMAPVAARHARRRRRVPGRGATGCTAHSPAARHDESDLAGAVR